MAFGDEVYSDESLEQRAKRVDELTERAAKVVREALAKAQRAQDARDQLLEANAIMLVEISYRIGSMADASCEAQNQAINAVKELRLNTGRDMQGNRPDTK